MERKKLTIGTVVYELIIHHVDIAEEYEEISEIYVLLNGQEIERFDDAAELGEWIVEQQF